jgi:hypothetical protein
MRDVRPDNTFMTNIITNITKNITNKIFAIPVSATEILPNPKTPAMIASIKKIIVQFSIALNPCVVLKYCLKNS